MTAMAEMSDDHLLVEQFRRGDEAAFTRIVERYSAEVAALANRLLGWPGDVEDVTQDIFLAAFLGLRKFRGDCKLKTWLFTITINKCRSYRHRWLLRIRRFGQAGTEAPGVFTTAKSQSLVGEEDFNRVRRAVAALPAKYREAVVLTYLQGLEAGQISRILGISRNALNVRLSRARDRLRNDLAQLWDR
jgi:RNA polymerase sigma-70 factor (ECF subfamily)